MPQYRLCDNCGKVIKLIVIYTNDEEYRMMSEPLEGKRIKCRVNDTLDFCSEKCHKRYHKINHIIYPDVMENYP